MRANSADEIGGEIATGLLSESQFSNFAWLIPTGIMDLLVQRAGDYIVIGAVSDNLPCGVIIAAASQNEPGSIKIVYLCVAPDYRRKGIATELINRLVSGLSTYDDTTKIFYSFALMAKTPENDPACSLLRGLGFTVTESSGGVYRTTVGALEDLPFWKQPIADKTAYIPVSKLPKGALADFSRKIMSKLGLRLPPFSEVGLIENVSHVLVIDGRTEGIAAVKEADGVLEISWLYCPNEHIRYLPDLVRSMYQEAIKEWPNETPLRIAAVADASSKLAKKLCPESAFFPYYDATVNLATLRTGMLAAERKNQLLDESRDELVWWNNITG
jgi:ribosomal protein S18 acetylase RimI-like enzyme